MGRSLGYRGPWEMGNHWTRPLGAAESLKLGASVWGARRFSLISPQMAILGDEFLGQPPPPPHLQSLQVRRAGEVPLAAQGRAREAGARART